MPPSGNEPLESCLHPIEGVPLWFMPVGNLDENAVPLSKLSHLAGVIEALKSKDSSVFKNAAISLSKHASPSPEAIQLIVQALRSSVQVHIGLKLIQYQMIDVWQFLQLLPLKCDPHVSREISAQPSIGKFCWYPSHFDTMWSTKRRFTTRVGLNSDRLQQPL